MGACKRLCPYRHATDRVGTNDESDEAFFRLPFLPLVQIYALFWRTYKRYYASGQNEPARWGSVSEGDTLLDYLFALLRDYSLVLELANREVGPVGVEGDDALENVMGTRAMSTNRVKCKRDAAELAFQSLVQSSASMAASAAQAHALRYDDVALCDPEKSTRTSGGPRSHCDC